ncbi:MAG: thiamine-phosphate kinase [Ectothiorhodospiraceae bacterium]|nr:thiamine-phosphate kinase [Ectothiorhodospiraceae bacterium]
MPAEFDLIRRWFTADEWPANVPLGVGDDAALLDVPAGQRLAVTTDTLVCGVHFLPDVSAHDLGHKALAVNLSDLAAMGAQPAWVLLALTLPSATDDAWLEAFSAGFLALARAHDVALVGGDTTQGPLSITVTAMGFVLPGAALTRAGAQPGDGVYVTGTLGDAALALHLLREGRIDAIAGGSELRSRLQCPTPRIGAGLALRGLASAAIDVSDGLAADLGHILERSGVGALLHADALPRSPAFRACHSEPDTEAWQFALSGGDDYELLFTLPLARESELAARFAALDVGCTRIGEIVADAGLRVLDRDGRELPLARRGYEHFRNGA